MAGPASRIATAFFAVALLAAPQVQAENQMGYRLFSAEQAAHLPRGGGVLGMDVSRGQVIVDNGMRFELLKVESVRRGAPAAQAGLGIGDQVVAVDGRVFPSVAAFAGYVGSLPPGRTISVDYLPRGGGPQNAQRVGVTLASPAGRGLPPQPLSEPAEHGLSTGQKLAIGAGAVALFGCYEMGCFSRSAQPR